MPFPVLHAALPHGAATVNPHARGSAMIDTPGSALEEEQAPYETKTQDALTEGAQAVARALGLRAENTIKNHVMAGMGLGLVPLPLFDLAALVGNQVAMIKALSELYEVPFAANRAKSIVIALFTGSMRRCRHLRGRAGVRAAFRSGR